MEVHIPPDILSSLSGKTVLITGSTSGIGSATVSLCLSHGANVIAGDISPSSSTTSSDSPTPKQNYIFHQTDVTNWSSIRNLFIQGHKHFGRIDHVFANAGVGPKATWLEYTFDEEGLLAEPELGNLRVNLIGLVYTVRLGGYYLSLPDASAQGAGEGIEEGQGKEIGDKSIVITASAASIHTFSAPDYAVSKHGALGLLRGLVGRLEGKIRINAIAPSWTDTGLIDRELLEGVGAVVQEADVVARSVALLFGDTSRHGEVVYSFDGRFWEINKAPGGLLEAAHGVLKGEFTEDEIMWRVRRRIAGEEF